MEILLEIVIIFGLILLNGFFSGAEIAVLTARRNRLQQAADAGSAAAKYAIALQEDTGSFLSTVQVGITGAGAFAAAYGGVSLVLQLASRLATSTTPLIAHHSQGIALAVVTSAIAFVTLVLGELVPKQVALAHAERLAQWVAPPMRLLSAAALPSSRCSAGRRPRF